MNTYRELIDDVELIASDIMDVKTLLRNESLTSHEVHIVNQKMERIRLEIVHYGEFVIIEPDDVFNHFKFIHLREEPTAYEFELVNAMMDRIRIDAASLEEAVKMINES